jgi:hypothetical protein
MADSEANDSEFLDTSTWLAQRLEASPQLLPPSAIKKKNADKDRSCSRSWRTSLRRSNTFTAG